MEPSTPERVAAPLWRRLTLAGLLVAAIFGAFRGTLDNGFVLLDDDVNIHRNRLIMPMTAEGLEQLWREPYNYMYIPVYYTTLGVIMKTARVPEGETVELAADGVDPRPFHVANLVAHTLCALLVYALLYALTRRDVPALLGAAVFALHPMQAEVVAWASAMKDLSSGVPALAALLAYVCFAQRRGWTRWLLWGLATVLFTLACLGKPSAIVLPMLALSLDVGLLRRNWMAAALAVAPWLLIGVGIALLAVIQPVDSISMNIEVWQRLAVAGDAVAFYLGQLVWPDRFVPFYDRAPVTALAGGHAWLLTLVPLALAVLALAVRKRSAVPLVALAIVVMGLGPVLGLVPFTFQKFSTVADRYFYLSMLGPALLVACGLAARPHVATYGLAVLVLGFFGARSAYQVEKWSETETLLTYTLEVNPNSSFAYTNLGEIYARRGEMEKGIAHFRTAVRLEPDSARTRNNLGSYLGQNGNLDEAVEHLQEAVRLEPDYARARLNLAQALSVLNRVPEALEQIRATLELEPDFAPAHFQHAMLLEAIRNDADAERAYAETVRLDPRMVDAEVRLGTLQLQGGRTAAAIATLRSAVSKQPENGLAHAELGRALYLGGQPGEAVPHLEKAQKLRPDMTHLAEFVRQARQASGQ
jgi:Tfp pilus assembly protein PilF